MSLNLSDCWDTGHKEIGVFPRNLVLEEEKDDLQRGTQIPEKKFCEAPYRMTVSPDNDVN